MAKPPISNVIPLPEERVNVTKKETPAGSVGVSTILDEHTELVSASLAKETVEIKRIPIDLEIDTVPEIQQDGDIIIIPIVEEKLVIEKRLVLREEIPLVKSRSTTQFEEPVTLRKMLAVINRDGAHSSPQNETNGEDS